MIIQNKGLLINALSMQLFSWINTEEGALTHV